MHNTYNPDRWVLVKIINTKNNQYFYKILASWFGGFTNPDSWKFSSGLKEDEISLEDNCFICPQFSGSCYNVNIDTYGLTLLTQTIALNFKEDSDKSNSPTKLVFLQKDEAIGILNDLLKQKS